MKNFLRAVFCLLLLVCPQLHADQISQIVGQQAKVFYGSGAPSGLCNASFNLNLFYVDTTGSAIWVCTASGYIQLGSNAGASATFPATPGMVYNTSSTASRNATSSDITTLLGYTPATSGVPVFQVAPHVLYSFVAPGDQSGTTVHDLSGNGINGTISNPNPIAGQWTGTGWAPCGEDPVVCNTGGLAAGDDIVVPTTAGGDRTWCFGLYLPVKFASNGQNYAASIFYNQGANATFTSLYFDQGNHWGQELYGPNLQYGSGFAAFSNFVPVAGYHTVCIIAGQSSNSTVDRIFMDGQESATGNPAGYGPARLGDTMGGLMLLAPSSNITSYITLQYVASWTGQLTTGQVKAASQTIATAVSEKGFPTTPQALLSGGPWNRTNNYIVALGDSITIGGGVATTQNWPALITGYNSAYTGVVNLGISGWSALEIGSYEPWKTGPYCSPVGTPSAAILFAGTNDISNTSALGLGQSTASTFNSIMSWVNNMKGTGCQLFVGTMLSRTLSDGNPGKDSLNPLIRSAAASGLFSLIDFASDPNIGCDGCNTSGTYFNTDHIHPLNAGQQLIANMVQNALAAYGVGAASAANPTPYTNTATLLNSDRYVTAKPTAATTYTLPQCLGITGATYSIFNAASGAFTITFAGQSGQAITGLSTLGQGVNGVFQATLISQTAGGCGWTRVL